MKDLTAIDLQSLATALEIAKTNDFIKTQHAKDVFMKALEESDFNTPKPVRKEWATPTASNIVTVTSQSVEQSTVEVK